MIRKPADIHVCLISKQVMQNLLPILADRPRRVYGVVTPQMDDGWNLLKRILKELDIEPIRHDAPPAEDWPALLEDAKRLATTIRGQHQHAAIALNMTGGTKLMSMAFVQAFTSMGAIPIYMDTPHDRIQEVLATNGSQQIVGDLLNVQNYLWAHNLEMTSALSSKADWRRASAEREVFTAHLAATVAGSSDSSFAVLWGQVKASANAADRTNQLTQVMPAPLKPTPEQRAFLESLPNVRVAYEPALSLQFPNRPTARYFAGGWVEEYVYHAFLEKKPHDFSIGVTVSWTGPRTGLPPPNELDAVAIHRNRMLLVECKDVSPGAPKGVAGMEKKQKIVDYFYKLNALRDLAQGLFGTTLLVSAQSLDATAVARAAQLKICLLAGHDVLRFREFLDYWADHRKAPEWAEPWHGGP